MDFLQSPKHENMGIESVDILIQRAQVLRGREYWPATALLMTHCRLHNKSITKGIALIIRDKSRMCIYSEKL